MERIWWSLREIKNEDGRNALPEPPTNLPLIVLGHPQLAASCQRAGSVFIPVSTPGIGAAGHLFRTDGVVLLPLFAVHDDGLPGAADVIAQITQELSS